MLCAWVGGCVCVCVGGGADGSYISRTHSCSLLRVSTVYSIRSLHSYYVLPNDLPYLKTSYCGLILWSVSVHFLYRFEISLTILLKFFLGTIGFILEMP